MIRFKANNVAQIRDENCPIDCCIVPIEFDDRQNDQHPEGPGNRRVSVLYAFYLFVREGINRVKAMNAPANLILAGYQRNYRWYDGLPTWTPVGGGDTLWNHPGGYQRRYDVGSGKWYWSLNNTNVGWDTT